MAAIRQAELGQGRDRQLRPTAGGAETGFLEESAPHAELLARGIDGGQGAVARHGAGDQLAHVGRVLQAAPVDRGLAM